MGMELGFFLLKILFPGVKLLSFVSITKEVVGYHIFNFFCKYQKKKKTIYFLHVTSEFHSADPVTTWGCSGTKCNKISSGRLSFSLYSF